jgi:hypothetical protein
MVTKHDNNKNLYKTNRRHTDRNEKRLEFPEFDVKIMKISTMMLLLNAQEDDVVERVSMKRVCGHVMECVRDFSWKG